MNFEKTKAMEPILTMTRRELEQLIEDRLRYCFMRYLSDLNELKVYHQAGELMTKKEAAKALAVPLGVISRYCRQGVLTCEFKGRGGKLLRTEVEALIKGKNRVNP